MNEMNGLQIVVLPRGWVMVGECEEKGINLVVKNASIVRRWGTENGLPQLANALTAYYAP